MVPGRPCERRRAVRPRPPARLITSSPRRPARPMVTTRAAEGRVHAWTCQRSAGRPAHRRWCGVASRRWAPLGRTAEDLNRQPRRTASGSAGRCARHAYLRGRRPSSAREPIGTTARPSVKVRWRRPAQNRRRPLARSIRRASTIATPRGAKASPTRHHGTTKPRADGSRMEPREHVPGLGRATRPPPRQQDRPSTPAERMRARPRSDNPGVQRRRGHRSRARWTRANSSRPHNAYIRTWARTAACAPPAVITDRSRPP